MFTNKRERKGRNERKTKKFAKVARLVWGTYVTKICWAFLNQNKNRNKNKVALVLQTAWWVKKEGK